MTLTHTTFQAVALLLAASALPAQQPAQQPGSPTASAHPVHHARPKPSPTAFNPNLIVLDPAHGGSDPGAKLAGDVAEKDVTLALANTLRGLLSARGFTVVLTRDNSTDDVPPDTRVELANRAHPLACILLHASPAGHGVHLFASALAPPSASPNPADPGLIVPWDTAQIAALPQSLRLVGDLASSLTTLRAPLVTGRVSVGPIDSLTCPAAAIEIAPVAGSAGTASAVSDPGYQQHVAEAVANALVFWRGHAQTAAAAAQAAAPTQAAPTPKPRPKPRPLAPGDQAPAGAAPSAAPKPNRVPAPIVRRPPPPPDPTPGAAR